MYLFLANVKDYFQLLRAWFETRLLTMRRLRVPFAPNSPSCSGASRRVSNHALALGRIVADAPSTLVRMRACGKLRRREESGRRRYFFGACSCGLPILSPQPARFAQYSQARQVSGELGL